MKLTKSYLKQIIKEELQNMQLNEEPRIYTVCKLAKKGNSDAIKGLKNWKDPAWTDKAKKCLEAACKAGHKEACA